ncbi:hypothetical protein IQ26_00185 [Mesorhizobium tianshanense]|uniref:Uncharacterized protein n=1 Tax=Mesorhizobium tianshanense TaxID=39844 RepID=A0A562PFW2_9HYPH|nr:hypothetical protein IQ26_00185 [Mesorhizobium tianshanense]
MTVADINRLEQAARISMGGFQDLEASAMPSHIASQPFPRFAAFALVMLTALIVALQVI